jgi:DNA-binding MarR family transcriptional regulator
MENNVAFLCADVSRLFRKKFIEAAGSSNRTGAQWRALINVQRFPGISQSGLAERLDVEPITTCRMIDRMEQSGLIERRRDPNDRRTWQLFLTPAAEGVTASMVVAGEKMLAGAKAGFEEEEWDILHRLLGRLRDQLTEAEATVKEATHGRG